MNQLWQFATRHEIGVVLGFLYALSAMVGSMPAPGTPGTPGQLFYRWFFDTIHTALNQVDKVIAARYPQAKLPTIVTSSPVVVQSSQESHSQTTISPSPAKENL